ncbi:MAG: hypothetical protein IT233_05395 [Bacteroidia bacterium]|nr:hypothetical protein [Bacteroidia bacterium]
METQRPVQKHPARELRLNRRAITFLVCLLIACMLWVVISLSESYVERRYFHVEYTHLPADVIRSTLPDTLSVEFSATGFNLMFRDPGHASVRIDLTGARITQNQLFYFLPGTMLAKQFSRQFGSGMAVTRIQPDTLKIMRIRGEGQWMKVRFKGEIQLGVNLAVADSIRISPDSVLVRGSVMGSEIYTVKVPLRGQEGRNALRVRLDMPEKNAVPETDSVTIQFTLEKFTEKEFSVPVSVKNLPPDRSFKPVPKTVNVKCLVPFSLLQEVDAAMFTASVDYNEIAGQNLNKAKVTLLTSHPKIRSLRCTPERVDFILRKLK